MKYLGFILSFLLLGTFSVVSGTRSRNDIVEVNGGKACAGKNLKISLNTFILTT